MYNTRVLDYATMQGKYPERPDDLLPPAESAKLIGISRDTLKRWEKKGRITALRTPEGHRRFRRRDVEALLTEPIEASA
jgi:excisionase family DNA binding protein